MCSIQNHFKTITAIIVLILISSSLYSQNLVEFKAKEKYGFKNAAGKVIVPAIYTAVEQFREGLAAVYKGGRWDEGLGILGGGKWGFVNSAGKEIIIPKYDDIGMFSDGLCAVVIFKNAAIRSGLWGFINKTGKLVIPFQFDNKGYFEDGLAEVEKDGTVYTIDKTGKEVVKPQDTTLTIVDDVNPKYKHGGVAEQLKFINDNLLAKYKSKLNGTRSTSYLEIIIGTDGKVREAKILRGVDPEADNDLLRVVKLLEFVPEIRMGRKLEVKYTLNHIW